MVNDIQIDRIQIDGGTQMRYQMDWVAIDEYCRDMIAGAQFPPIVVFQNGKDSYWLADGFHRVHAALKAEHATIAADIRPGGKRDAILHAVAANADHGVRRTNADKRKAVQTLLNDDEWHQRSDRWIARQCVVSDRTVNRMRETICDNVADRPKKKKVQRKGKTYTQDITNIGRPKEPEPEPPTIFDAPEDESPADDPTTHQLGEVTIIHADARNLHHYELDPVHLVITSPPYNVGIDYSAHNDALSTYWPWQTDIWHECYQVMEEGARICVVCPLGVGRNPWMPFADLMRMALQQAGFVLRGQILWDKSMSGNRTSWGSYRMSSNPSLRDTMEAVIVANKGDGALAIPDEYKLSDDKGTYTPWLADGEYFMSLASDHWKIPPAGAKIKGHPAPFPHRLVRQLIHFYAYPGAHVLDPFSGSGTVGVVAKELGCHATLVEIDDRYIRLAKEYIDGR